MANKLVDSIKSLFTKSNTTGRVYDLQEPYPFYYDDVELDEYGKPIFWNLNYKGDIYPSRYEQLVEGYAYNPYFYMVIDRIATTAARLKRYYVDESNPERIPNTVAIENLLKKPNQKDSKEEFFYRIYASYLTTGNAFVCGINPLGFNTFSELIVPSSRNVEITRDQYGNPITYTITYFDSLKTLSGDETDKVLHIQKPDITRDYEFGFSSMIPNRFTYKANNEINQSEYFLHRNKGVNGILTNRSGRAMSPKERASMQKEYDEQTQGSKFGKVKVATQNLDFIRMGTNPSDLKSIEAKIEHLRTACATFGVASQLFGDKAGATYNNMQEAKVAMYTDVVLPLCYKIDSELSEWLIQTNLGLEDVCIKVDESKIPVLNKPNNELSAKLIAEVNAGLIDRRLASHLLYPDYYEEPDLSEDLTEDTEEDVQD